MHRSSKRLRIKTFAVNFWCLSSHASIWLIFYSTMIWTKDQKAIHEFLRNSRIRNNCLVVPYKSATCNHTWFTSQKSFKISLKINDWPINARRYSNFKFIKNLLEKILFSFEVKVPRDFVIFNLDNNIMFVYWTYVIRFSGVWRRVVCV